MLAVALLGGAACSTEALAPAGSGGTGPSGNGQAGAVANPGQSGATSQGGAQVGGGAGSSSAGQAPVGGGVTGGGAGGALAGGSGGASSTGGSGGVAGGAGGVGGGTTEPGYTPPPRDIMLQPGSGPVNIGFTPQQAAPGAMSFHGGQQQARFNADSPKVQKKLVLGLGGVGTGAHNGGGLGWAADRGYHTIGIDYFNASGGDQGKNYLESWSGEDVGDGNVGQINSIMNRVKTALTYLQMQDPGDDWAYYLDAQGNVRWNDVIIFGYSFGGQTAAAATKYVALHRVVATSAPGINEAAAWVKDMPALTPGNRCFSISGTDDGGHANHMATATRLGWPGIEVATSTSAPPYDNSSLLAVDFGHSEFCSLPPNVLANADELCEWAFGYVKP